MSAQTGRVFRPFGQNNRAIVTKGSIAKASLYTVVESSEECSRFMALPPTEECIEVFTSRNARKKDDLACCTRAVSSSSGDHTTDSQQSEVVNCLWLA